MTTTQFHRTAAGFCLAALVAAGCGSDSNKRLSYADTGKRLDAICGELNAKGDALSKTLTQEVKHDAPIVEDLTNLLEEGVKRIKDVEPADELQPTFDELTGKLDEQLDAYRSLEATAKKGDQESYQVGVEDVSSANKTLGINALFSKLGAAGCAKD